VSVTVSSAETSTALDRERVRLLHETIAISHSARELALTADLFSERVATVAKHSPFDLDQVQGHLAQLRRNCADAQYMAETVRGQLDNNRLTWHMIQACDDTLRDAQVRLTLADLAYDRACEVAG
jgi:hypothetical protein